MPVPDAEARVQLTYCFMEAAEHTADPDRSPMPEYFFGDVPGVVVTTTLNHAETGEKLYAVAFAAVSADEGIAVTIEEALRTLSHR